jgi:transcriptional regulator with XRE-family HTH domain
MISPYVRRLRLAAELVGLREAAGLTHEQLAAKIGQPRSRSKISRLENGRIRPAQAEILKILEALEVTGPRWDRLMEVARDAAERGWWVDYGEDMGVRQAVYADLEAGASRIREFHQTFIPGLLQIPEFTRQRSDADAHFGPVSYTVPRAAEARQLRQKMVLRLGGPTYEVVLDEVAVRRWSAPPQILRRQLEYLVRLLPAMSAVTVRVLPVDARIEGYVVPRSAFSLYSYPDAADPRVVAVDTVTDDLVLTTLDKAEQVERYERLFIALADAARSPEDSIAFLAEAAERLSTEVGVA